MKSTRAGIDPFLISDRELAGLVLDQTETAIVICDKAMHIVLANPAAHQLCGGDPVGLIFPEAFHLEWAPSHQHALEQRPAETKTFSLEAVLQGEELRGECILERAQGARLHVAVSSAPYRGPQDDILCCIVSMIDVTDFQTLKESQQSTLNILNAVIEGATDAIYVKNLEGRYLMINAAGAAVMGRTPEQVTGHLDLEMFEASTAAMLRADDARVREHGRAELIEQTLALPTGFRMFQSVKAPYRDVQGEIVGVIGVSRDVTSSRRVQAELARQAALLDLSPDAINVHGLDGTITFWNRGAEKMYGWRKEQALGTITHILLGTEFSTPRDELHTQLVKQGHWEGELTHYTRAGQRITVASQQVTQYDDAGHPVAILEINQDITERKRYERTQEFLIEATNALSFSLDFPTTLQNIAQLVVPFLADWCAVHILMDDGTIQRLAFAHRDPAQVERVGRRPQVYALDENARYLVPHVLQTGQPEIFNEVPDSLLAEAARDADHLETLRRLGLEAYLCLPLVARGQQFGTVTFAMSESGRRYTPRDIELAQELVRRASLAADNARSFQESQRAREQLELIARISVELMASLSFETRVGRLAELIVPQLADWCAINLVERDGSIRLAASTHMDPAQRTLLQEWAARHPLSRDKMWGTPNVIATGKTEWAPELHLPPDDELEPEQVVQSHYLRELRVASYMIVPLNARGRTLGAITLARCAPNQNYTFEDLVFVEEIARRTAMAMDNAFLYQQEQSLRRETEENASRIAALQLVTGALGSAVTRQQVAQVILDQGLGAIHAHGGLIVELGDDQMVRTLSQRGYPPKSVDEWTAFSVTQPVSSAEVIRTRQPLVFESQDQLTAHFQGSGHDPYLSGYQAGLVMPLELEGHVLGALTMSFKEPRTFSDQDLAFARALAQQCAQALERARLYDKEQAARLKTEQNASRVAALQLVTAALGAAVTRQQVAHVVLEQGLSALSASGGFIGELGEDEIIRILSYRGYPPDFFDTWMEFSVHLPVATAEVMRMRKPLALESRRALLERYPSVATEDRLLDYHAWLVMPLELEGHVLGALTMSFKESRTFSAQDLAFARALAQQCAQALERARLYETEQAARQAAELAARRSRWLNEAAHLLSSSLDYPATLKQLANLAVPSLADWCQIHIAKEDGTAERLVVAHKDQTVLKWAEELSTQVAAYFQTDWNSPIGLPKVLRTGKPEAYYDIPDALLVSWAKNEMQLKVLRQVGLSSLIIVPLNSRGQTLGALTLINTESRRHFDDDDLTFAELLAERAAVAIENARLFEAIQQLNTELESRVHKRTAQLREAYQELRGLAARLQTIREDERADIARELHDELGQALTALKMDVATLISRVPKRSQALQERAHSISVQIDATIKSVRRLSSQLRPGMLDDLGLAPSLEWYADDFQARTGIASEVNTPEQDLPLDRTQATALFRIFQETLTNVARHAQATQVKAELTVEDGVLSLRVHDNGVGIDLTQARVKRSLGLVGMRERAEMISGTLEISGEPGKGTTVMVRVPLTPQAYAETVTTL